jgi:phosphonopyruvate decarboxylase
MERSFLEPSFFYNELHKREIDFFTGVPDSLLKDFCGYISDHTP